MTSRAEDSRLRVRGMSSRQPLASLSTRTGRLRSRSKETEQRLRVEGAGGTGGGGGAVIPTEVVAVACLPRSSTTLQVTVTVPGVSPAVLSVAVVPLPLMVPEDAE